MLGVLAAAVLSASSCGQARWDVKTLSDPRVEEVSHRPIAITLAQLTGVRLAVFWGPDLPRQSSELALYTVSGAIIGFKLEKDRDIHAVLSSGGKTMVVEFPDARCIQNAPLAYQAAMKAARSAFISAFGRPTAKYVKLAKPRAVKVTGVLFFDDCHGQAGAAPNCVELHPVLEFAAQ